MIKKYLAVITAIALTVFFIASSVAATKTPVPEFDLGLKFVASDIPEVFVGEKVRVDEALNNEPWFSDNDVETLARCVYAEARDQPYEGMVAVAEVVVNRLRDGRWGDTIYKVITSRRFNGKRLKAKQFAYWRDYIHEPMAFERCRDAAQEALEKPSEDDDVLYFKTEQEAYWYGPYVVTIGSHSFYRADD